MASSKVTVTAQMEAIEKEFLKKYCDKVDSNYSMLIRRALREYFIKRKVLKEDSKMFLRMG